MAGFSARVTGDAWQAEVRAWLDDVVAARGNTITAVRRSRVRPWSTQLVVETTGGRLWFKAGCTAQQFEPALQTLLARLVPQEVDMPVAVRPEQGWMLTADRGDTLGDRREPGVDDWAGVLRAWARVQQAATEHADEVRATGVPDHRPERTGDRFAEMLDRLAALPSGHPAALSDDAAARLRDVRPAVEEAARTLVAGPFPVTVQHGDLHPWNVFEVDGALRVFDLGDAQWAHPLEALMVPRAVIEDADQVVWTPVRDAYLAEWSDAWSGGSSAGPPARPTLGVPTSAPDSAALDEQMGAATLTHAVNRSASWWDALGEASDTEWARWGEAPVRHLVRVADVVAAQT